MSSLYDCDLALQTKPSSLYRHQRRLGLHRVGYKEGDLTSGSPRLSSTQRRVPSGHGTKSLSLVSSRSNSPTKVNSPAVRIPPNPGLPQSPFSQILPKRKTRNRGIRPRTPTKSYPKRKLLPQFNDEAPEPIPPEGVLD